MLTQKISWSDILKLLNSYQPNKKLIETYLLAIYTAIGYI